MWFAACYQLCSEVWRLSVRIIDEPGNRRAGAGLQEGRDVQGLDRL